MAIKILCQSCGRALRARDEFAGKRGECPYCGVVLHVPPSSEEPVQAELVGLASSDCGGHGDPSVL